MSFCSFGQIGDLKTRNLCIGGKIVIDRKRNITGNIIHGKTLQIKKDALICGDLRVKGNIFQNDLPLSQGYNFTNEYINQQTLITQTAGDINWIGVNRFVNVGHMFTGPLKPMKITMLAGDSSGMPYDCEVIIQELNEIEINQSFPVISGNLTTMALNGDGNTNTFITATVLPTKTPGWWHYYCGTSASGTTFIKSIAVNQL